MNGSKTFVLLSAEQQEQDKLAAIAQKSALFVR
jgi:hypothetical protein